MEEIEIGVEIGVGKAIAPKPDRAERLIFKLGGPRRTLQICDRLGVSLTVAPISFLTAAAISLLFRPPSYGALLAIAWVSVTLLIGQHLVAYLRLRALALYGQEAEAMAYLTIQGFHARVAEKINEALHRYEHERAEEKPTLQ